MILLIDNYDSFTYNLYDYILQLDLECKVVRNDQLTLQEINELNFSSIVISPGPCTPGESGICMELIAFYHDKCPILGICLGYQALGEYFGAKLIKAIKPMHGKVSTISILNKGFLFKYLHDSVEVMRYHSLVLKEIKSPLKLLAVSEDNEPMAFQHTTLPIAGVQFHPESILTKKGLEILGNWFDYIN